MITSSGVDYTSEILFNFKLRRNLIPQYAQKNASGISSATVESSKLENQIRTTSNVIHNVIATKMGNEDQIIVMGQKMLNLLNWMAIIML